MIQVDEYSHHIIDTEQTCASLAEYDPVLLNPWHGMEDPEQVYDKQIFNDVPYMPDNWYWRDKPLHKNTIKQGQKYWVD